MAVKFPSRCKHTTSTTGTGTYTLSSSAAPAGYRLLSRAITDGDLVDGDTVNYICVDTTVVGGVKLLELGSGVYNLAANTVTRAAVYQPGAAAVNWGAGTRDFYIIDNPLAFFVIANNLSEGTAATMRTNLGLGTAAIVDTGTTANKILKLDGSAKIPAVDGSQLTGLPASPIPAGTKMLFYADTAPSGWTKITTIDDTLVAITNSSGTGGGGPHTGGTTGGIGWDASFGLSVGSHTLAFSELPATVIKQGAFGSATGGNNSIDVNTGGGGGHTHTISGSSTWRPTSAYFILCQKT